MKTSDENLIVGCAKTAREEESDEEIPEEELAADSENNDNSDDVADFEDDTDTDAGQEILEKLGLDE